MNNTVQTNQSYQKPKEILTARYIINQWLSAGSVLIHQPVSHCISQSAVASASQPLARCMVPPIVTLSGSY